MDSVEPGETEEAAYRSDGIYGAAYGKPGLTIATAYIKAALELLTLGAKCLHVKKVVNTATSEDHVTYLLDKEMRAIQRANKSDIIRWVIQPNIQRDPTDPLLRCEPDFVFLWIDEETDPDLGLYAEAKRLFGTGSSLADKYVEEGVLDFVEARYGRGHNYGIMLGYVLTGPLQEAISRVKKAMGGRKMKTAECSAFSPDNSLCSHPHTHHSGHLQHGTITPMTLIHLFLDFV